MWENIREEITLQKKSVLITLILVILILILTVAGALGYLWYQENHLFVEDAVYPMDAEVLDLRGQDISFNHYDTVHWQLPGCRILWDVPFQGGKVANDSTQLSVTTLTQEDLDIIYRYLPGVTTLNAAGCTEYDLLERFRREKPDCQVIYQVALGGTEVDYSATELTLMPQNFDLNTLRENLAHLPQVTAITFRSAELLPEELEALKADFAHISFQATVNIRGEECDNQTTELNLAGMTGEEVEEVCRRLSMLPNLQRVELMDGNNSCQLENIHVKQLKDSAPGVVFNYQFEFFGKTINTADEEVVIRGVKIGDENVDQVRSALDMMDGCRRFVLDSCGLSDEVMAKLREEYRGKTKVVWRVSFAKGNALTDAEVVYVSNDLRDSNCQNLVYFEDARYLDAGHNDTLTDISFISGMPNLEVVILSGSSIKDLSGFANCKKLRVLELCYCGLLSDISPLAACESLELVNISFTAIRDLSALDGLPIKNLCALNTSSKRVSQQEQQRFKLQHPDCETHYAGSDQPYGTCWRYEPDDAFKFRDWYVDMATAFDYDHYERNFSKAWYLTETGERDQTRTA